MKKTVAVLVLFTFLLSFAAVPASALDDEYVSINFGYSERNGESKNNYYEKLNDFDEEAAGTGLYSGLMLMYDELIGCKLGTKNSDLRESMRCTDRPYSDYDPGMTLYYNVNLTMDTMYEEADATPLQKSLNEEFSIRQSLTIADVHYTDYLDTVEDYYQVYPYDRDIRNMYFLRYGCYYGDYFRRYGDSAVEYLRHNSELSGDYEEIQNAVIYSRNELLNSAKREDVLLSGDCVFVSDKVNGAEILFHREISGSNYLYIVRDAYVVRMQNYLGEEVGLDNMNDIALKVIDAVDRKTGRSEPDVLSYIVCFGAAILIIASSILFTVRGRRKNEAGNVPEEEKQ